MIGVRSDRRYRLSVAEIWAAAEVISSLLGFLGCCDVDVAVALVE